MSRFRANTARSAEDRAVVSHLDRAAREVEQALQVARGARGMGYRARRVERDLRRALAAIEEVGSIMPPYGGAIDPDSMSEEERNRLAREAREARRVAEVAPPPTVDIEEGDG